MITAVLYLILITIIVAYLIHHAYEKPCDNFPPGPPRIPFFGSYPLMLLKDYKWSAKVCSYWGKIYNTDIVGFYFGPYPAVSLNSLESIKAFFNTPEYDGRLDIFSLRYRSFGERYGIFFNDGPEWLVQKRFSLRFMRDFGFGRRSPNLESITEQEIKHMLEICEKGPQAPGDEEFVKKGGLVKLPDVHIIPMVYPLLNVITNKTFTRESDDFIRKSSKEGIYLQQSFDDLGGFLAFMPWVRHISPYLSGFEYLARGHKAVMNVAKSLLGDNINTEITEDDHEHNFLDLYVKRMKTELEKNGESPFSERQLSLILVDFLFPTMTGNAMVLLGLIKQMIAEPEIQAKAQEEIDRVVGRGRLPNLDDRINLGFNEACFREYMRRWTPVHFALPHLSVKDTKFMGYDIPKNTAIVPNLLHMHMDKKVWGDPENYRPERFLDSDGKLSVKKDFSLPFGAGRRLCAGETYARNTIFLIFTALMQNYHMSMPDGSKPDIEKEGIPGLLVCHADCWIKLTPRS